MNRHKLLLSLVSLLWCWSSCLLAAGLQISLIRATLCHAQPYTTVTVTNVGDCASVYQLKIKKWTQQNGQDVFSDAQDVLATPPIFTVAAHASQVIRLGLLRPPYSQNEMAYRLFIHEVPMHRAASAKGLQVLLQFTIPIFVAPLTPVVQHLAWQGQLDGQTLHLHLSNDSNVHVQVSKLSIFDPATRRLLNSQDTFAYLLPAQNKEWILKMPNDVAAKHLQVTAVTDQGVVSAPLSLAASKN